MSVATLVVLTVVEILALVAVLAVYLALAARRLHAISRTLGQVAFGVRAVEQQASTLGPNIARVNATLERIVTGLPDLTERARRSQAVGR